jgi:hypothetical protein
VASLDTTSDPGYRSIPSSRSTSVSRSSSRDARGQRHRALPSHLDRHRARHTDRQYVRIPEGEPQLRPAALLESQPRLPSGFRSTFPPDPSGIRPPPSTDVPATGSMPGFAKGHAHVLPRPLANHLGLQAIQPVARQSLRMDHSQHPDLCARSMKTTAYGKREGQSSSDQQVCPQIEAASE